MKYKQTISLLLVAVMALVLLSGCGNSQVPAQNTSTIPSTDSISTTEPVPDYNHLVDVFSEEARAAVLADGTLELAAQMPDAAWNSLPK